MTRGCGPRRKPPLQFKCNRPFIFIVHKYRKNPDRDPDNEESDDEGNEDNEENNLPIYFMAMVDLNGLAEVGEKRERID